MTRIWQLITYPFRRGVHRPLAARRLDWKDMGQISATPLGMEATDLAMIDRVARQNDALERILTFGAKRNRSFMAHASAPIGPKPEDETNAARFHRAYNKKDH